MDENLKSQKLMCMIDLYEKIQKLSKYYNKETINYLYSLLFCSESVFSRLDFVENFSELSFFYELAKYNLYNRTIVQLSKLSIGKKDEFNYDEYDKGFRISYQDKFPVFDFKTLKEYKNNGEEIGPIITIYNVTQSIEDRIENIKTQITNLYNSDYNNNYIEKNNDEDRALYHSMFGTYSSKKVFFYKRRIEELSKKIEFIKTYGDIQAYICNLVTDSLLENWCITFEDNEYIKRLHFVDIYKKRL